jgi:hypothetical protein
MEEQGFQGWSNRETWATNLWITNDEGLYEIARDYASTALEEHKNDDPSDEGAGYSFALYCLQETLKSWIEEDLLTLENIKGNRDLWMMLTDIGSLYRVDWQELAGYYLDEIKEEVA